MRYLVTFLLLCVPAFAQTDSVTVHGVTIPVIGHDAVTVTAVDGPLVSTDTDVVYVPEGVTATVGADVTCYDCIVEGTLEVTGNLKVRTLTAPNTGHLKLTGNCNLTIRAIPPDDPEQIGTGLIVPNGKLTIEGQAKYPYAKVAQEVLAGQTVVQLEAVPAGWEVGDTLVLPDTVQPEPGYRPGTQTEEVTVTAINGTAVSITPAQFAHLGWHNQAGGVEELFHVGNLDQSVVIRSEDPSVVRGHAMAFGHADVIASNFTLDEMGRTTTAPLDAANIIGRYSWHAHHLVGRPDNGREHQFLVEQCVVRGSAKWGMVLHHSHYGCYQDSFVYDCAGGHLVTEDPLVYGNVVRRNLCIGRREGSGQRITDRSHRNDSHGDHWHNQVGLGLASAANEITGNTVYGCVEGIGMAGFGTTQMVFELDRGAHGTGEQYYNSDGSRPGTRTSYPWAFDTSGNTVWGSIRGIETWTANSFPDIKEKMFPGLEIYHSLMGTNFEDQQETTLYGWKIRGDFSKAAPNPHTNMEAVEDLHRYSVAIKFKGGYEFGQTHVGCEYAGHDFAVLTMNPAEYSRFINCVFECPTNIYEPEGRLAKHDWIGEWIDCEFRPVNGKLEFIDINRQTLWLRPNRPDRPFLGNIEYHVSPWIDGTDIRIYHRMQHPDFALEPLSEGQSYNDFPEGVYTQQQLIDLGTPIFGDAVPENAYQSEHFGDGTRFWAAVVNEQEPTLTELIDALDESPELKAVLHKLNETR